MNEIPDRLYKFIPQKFGSRMLQGNIQVNTLYRCRKDYEGYDIARSDPNEGIVTKVYRSPKENILVGDDVSDLELKSKAIDSLENFNFSDSNVIDVNKVDLGIKLKGSQIIVYGDIKINEGIGDAFIYCTSTEFHENLFNKFGNWCIEVTNLHLLIETMKNKIASKVNKMYNKTRIKYTDIFYAAGKCKYGSREVIMPKSVDSLEGVFLKGNEFDDQYEFRFCFIPYIVIDGNPNLPKEGELDKIIIKIDEPDRYFKFYKEK